MKLLHVPYISQKDTYPTGCESVSTVMLLNYLGIHISVDEFIDKYLPCRNFEVRNGKLYGADPRVEFCGSPYREDDFGCYAPVIQKALEKVFEDFYDRDSETHNTIQQNQLSRNQYKVFDETGRLTSELLQEYIDQGMPVIYWACIDMKEPVVGPSWKLLDTGKDFTWISNEHCMLLVGYDEDNYYFNDPYEGHGLVAYTRNIVEDRHRAQYEMAIGVKCLYSCLPS